MTSIHLQPIDQTNFLPCFQLELAQGQDAFVSHPIRSLAQAYVYREQCVPFGSYADETMVGYVLVLYDYDEAAYNIWHMMIDRRHQGRGYGRQAMEQVLAYIAQKPFGPSNQVLLTCNPDNTVAYKLYQRLGFTETGRRDDDEVELGYQLPVR